MADNMDGSLLTDVVIEDLSFDCSMTAGSSGLDDSMNFKLQKKKSGITPDSHTTVADGYNHIAKRNVCNEEFFYNVIKPLCPNLADSYSELFSDRMNEPGFRKEFVAKRVAAALDKVNKSQSLSSLIDTPEMDIFNYGFVNTSNVRRSLECLNESSSKHIGTTLNTSLAKENNDTYVAMECHKLRKSSSFSGYSNLNKNESLIDMEMELEDSVPSEDEKDEMGLPVRKYLFCGTPEKKKHDITETLQKYKKILRASFGETSRVVNNFDEEETVAATIHTNQPASTLLSDAQDVHLKKTLSKAGAKGPMKALMPLQTMTKHVGAMLLSPFKKKKVKTINGPPSKDSSHISDDSFDFLHSQPVAVSTPTSRGTSRNESVCSKNRSFQRSFSEERVTNKASDITQTISQIKKSVSTSRMSVSNNTRSISRTDKTFMKSAPINNTRQSIASASKTVRNSGLKRPSTAPVSIKAPLSSRLSENIKKTSILSEVAKPLASKLNTKRNVLVSQRALNPTGAMKSSGSGDKKTLLMPKLRRPSSHINKENK